MLRSTKTALDDWLVQNCNMDRKEATELADRLRKKCFIESVGSLRQCAFSTPDVLDCLKLSKSFELVLFDQLVAKIVKPLTDVTVSEVSVMLQNVFPDQQQYSAALFRSRISGFVLSTATTCQGLMELGIRDREHALRLLGHLSAWKESGVPNHYLRVASSTSAKSPITMLPRKRGRDENIPPNVGTNNDASNDTKQKAQPSSSASNFAVSTHTNKLISSDEKVRLDALARLHKEVEKDKNIVNTFLHTGVLDKLLDMRIDPSKEVVYKMLCLLNLVIQRGDKATLNFLIQDKQLIEKLGPKMWSLSHRVRMEIVRIVISVANTSQYPTLLQHSVMQAMVNLYFMAINDVRGRDAEEVRHRLALALKALCLGTENSQHLSTLAPCLSVLRDILATDQNGFTTLPAVCAAIHHLIQLATNKTAKERVMECNSASALSAAVAAPADDVLGAIGRQVLPSMTIHFTDKKETTVLAMLFVLSAYTEACRDDHLALLLPALVALQKLLSSEDSSQEVKLAVVQFLLPLCQQSGSAVTLLIEVKLFPIMLQMILAGEVKNEFSQGAELEQNIQQTAARAFLTAVEKADDNQLPYFLLMNVYAALLKLIARSAPRGAWQEVLLHALGLLRSLILRVQGIDEEENFTAEEETIEIEAWMAVQRLALGYAVLPLGQEENVQTTGVHKRRKVGERKSVSDEVKQAAAALVKTACSMGILEVAKSV